MGTMRERCTDEQFQRLIYCAEAAAVVIKDAVINNWPIRELSTSPSGALQELRDALADVGVTPEELSEVFN